MAIHMSRKNFLALLGVSSASLLAGCTPSYSAASSIAHGTRAVVVGTLATEDMLPLWVAQTEGLDSNASVDLDIVVFQSATELIAGVASGEIDLAMTDIMVSASMFASGIDICLQWVTLGETADQGRFGIMVGPGSSITQPDDLAGVPIGVGSNTILEYVMDNLLAQAGLEVQEIIVEEIQKLPLRYQALMSGDVAAAALPGTLLALGEANGCTVIADDTAGENLSQSVMIAQTALAQDDTGLKLIAELARLWNTGVDLINANPEAFRSVLVEKANLPEDIAQSYRISTYPQTALPRASMVDPVLSWMQEKAYLTEAVSYDETTGFFSLV